MKHKRLLTLSIATLGIIGAFNSVSAASVASLMPHTNHQAVHTAIKNAVLKNDYQAFLVATKDKPAGTPTITEVQFNTLVQAEKLRASGDQAGAKALIEAAGIQMPQKGKMGRSKAGKSTMMTNLTDAQKATLTQAHTLMEAGKKDEAIALLKSAGISFPVHPGKGMMHSVKKQ